jgi:hypothetical protein
LVTLSAGCKNEGKIIVDPPPTQYCNYSKAQLEEINIFPADNPWHLDVSSLPVDSLDTLIRNQIKDIALHPDFGAFTWNGAPVGIPYVVVCSRQPTVTITYRANSYDGNYGSESDQGPFPIPPNAPVEGNGSGDAHVIAVDMDAHKLYELYNASKSSTGGGGWEASCGAVFDLNSNAVRTIGWTSADAAGLPIFPGLVRYDEVAKGTINHAIRFTLARDRVQAAYVFPASHQVNGTGGASGLPLGARMRLKAGFDISSYPANVQVILRAMKKYGIILADIGSNMFISGAPDDRWNDEELNTLRSIKVSDFQVVQFH